MTSQTATVTAALLDDSTVAATIGTNIFVDSPPDEAAFPCLTYEEYLTPALAADNDEAAYTAQFNMEAYARKSAWALADAVESVMKSLGYVCGFKRSAGMVGVMHQVSMTFTNTKEG